MHFQSNTSFTGPWPVEGKQIGKPASIFDWVVLQKRFYEPTKFNVFAFTEEEKQIAVKQLLEAGYLCGSIPNHPHQLIVHPKIEKRQA